MRFRASAPGKAVLAGEYAVLHGAPAISMAVDCRASVGVQPSGGEWHGVRVPGANPVRFRVGPGGELEWERPDDRGDWALLEHVAREGRCALPAGSILKLDTEAFSDTGSGLKLGFGSSSALAVALAAAWLGGEEDPARAEALAAAAHRAFQDGRGSGVDVATAVHGGVIGYWKDRPVRKLEWPQGLQHALLWCGQPASTADRLVREEEFRRRGKKRSAERLGEQAEAVLDAWGEGADSAIVESFAAYVEALRAYSDDARLGVFDAGHGELAEMARQYGMVYKPCGAGGGDIGVVLSARGADPADFIARSEGLGFRHLGCALEPRGLVVETRENG